MRPLRALATWVLHGTPPCVVCGRERFVPGAIPADVCETHFRERLKLLEAR